MGDLRIKRIGPAGQEGTIEYYVFGLDAKADDIASAAGKLASAIDGRIAASSSVISAGQGPYVMQFANEARLILIDLGRLHHDLARGQAAADAFPVDAGSAGVAEPAFTFPEARPGPDVEANTTALDAFVATGDATDGDVASWGTACGYDDLSLTTFRVDEYGELVAFDDGLGLPAVVALPEPTAQAEAAGTRAAAFTAWVRLVAERFRRAGEGEQPDLTDLLLLGGAAGYSQGIVGERCPNSRPHPCTTGNPCRLYGYCPYRAPVIQPGEGGGAPDFVLRLEDGQVTDFTPEQWSWLFQAEGIDGAVPLHFVVHGLDNSADEAAAEVDGLYPDDGDAVVIAVNWDAGDSGLNFPSARDRADGWVGDSFGNVLAGVSIANPTATVAITGHSLGAKVAVEGLSAYEEWLAENELSNELSLNVVLIQAAITTNDDDLDALYGPLVEQLTVTVDPGDDALIGLDLISEGDAFGALPPEHVRMVLLDVERGNAGVETEIVQHYGEHLSLNPADEPIVSQVITEQIAEVLERAS